MVPREREIEQAVIAAERLQRRGRTHPVLRIPVDVNKIAEAGDRRLKRGKVFGIARPLRIVSIGIVEFTAVLQDRRREHIIGKEIEGRVPCDRRERAALPFLRLLAQREQFLPRGGKFAAVFCKKFLVVIHAVALRVDRHAERHIFVAERGILRKPRRIIRKVDGDARFLHRLVQRLDEPVVGEHLMPFLMGHDEIGRIGIVVDLIGDRTLERGVREIGHADRDLVAVLRIELRNELIERPLVLAVDDGGHIDLNIAEHHLIILIECEFARGRPPCIARSAVVIVAVAAGRKRSAQRRTDPDRRDRLKNFFHEKPPYLCSGGEPNDKPAVRCHSNLFG